jgi:hypothetical protein
MLMDALVPISFNLLAVAKGRVREEYRDGKV